LTSAEARERTLLHRIYAFVEQQLTDPGLSPRSIAAAHHVSLRYLYKLFAIGGHWGFSSAAHFSRAFRDEYGVPPAEFRARSAIPAALCTDRQRGCTDR